MRISMSKILQFIDSTPAQLVLMDEANGVEISLTPTEVDTLSDRAIPFFHPYMHKMFSPSTDFQTLNREKA